MQNTNRSFARTLGFAIASLAMVASVQAAGIGGNADATLNGKTFTGTGGAYTEAATSGGGQASTKNYGNGDTYQVSQNSGNTTAYATVSFSGLNPTSSTGGSSKTESYSAGTQNGGAQGNTAGSVGNDYASKAWASGTKTEYEQSFSIRGQAQVWTW